MRRVLTNSIYCGRYVNNKYEIEAYLTGKQVHIPEEQHYHHDRPEWAIVTPEKFDAAQELMNSRRKQYDSGPPFIDARFSTNDQFTATKCDNTVTINEPELLEEIRTYFASLISDKQHFIESVLSDFHKSHKQAAKKVDTGAIELKRKKLLAKKERYQEMYANDVITMTELKLKTDAIAEELREIDCDIKRYEQSQAAQKDSEDINKTYIREIERFLSLESVTNLDLRRILDHISVNKSGVVTVILKDLEDIGTSEPTY